ncbi:MAG: methyltransferase domain-containing protein [Alphaproteobacteria bacterium]|nr:methyltransferase domain-containing protein [Alphaproteobacteria bacterium]
MVDGKVTEGGQEFFENCLTLLIEMAGHIPVANFVANPTAATRLDVAIANLKNVVSSNASELALQALSLEPDSAYAFTVWGLALAKAGDVEKSLFAFDTAIDLDRRFLLAICGKILMLKARGETPGLSQEVSLLWQQLLTAYNDVAKVFAQILGSMGAQPENTTRYVNIGGGPNFNFLHWRNLESVCSESNPDPIRFSPECDFPLEGSSVELVYTSHCLEHLDDPTVARALVEAHRILRPDGALLVKIPDFDYALDDWRKREPGLICAPVWGVEALQPTWEAHGVADTLDTRAAFIFSGFWNDEYGDENGLFSGNGKHADGAYVGPPRMPSEELRDLAERSTPYQIAQTLRQHIVDNEPSYHFNHQNAWSRDEFDKVLTACGFEVLSFDRAKIIKRYHWIPLIEDMDHMSLYCFAVPR